MPSTEDCVGFLRCLYKGSGMLLVSLCLVLPGLAFDFVSALPVRPSAAVSGGMQAPDSGKLIEAQAFSGKMLGVEVPDPLGAGDANGGISLQMERPGSGSRRILWRQIQ